MRIVLDTNVLISGLIRKDGPPGELLRLWTDDAFILVTSHFQLAELTRAMNYERLRPRIRPDQQAAFFDHLPTKAEIAEDLPVIERSSDPDDNLILATAVAGAVDLIVSGDKRHLVSLGSIEGIPIVTPRQALERLAT